MGFFSEMLGLGDKVKPEKKKKPKEQAKPPKVDASVGGAMSAIQKRKKALADL